MWYPTEPAYNGAMGAPIVVDSNWSVLIAGSNTSHSAPINMSGPQGGANAGNTPFPPNAFQRDHNVSAPSLFAVRGWGKAGRVALLNQWRQFTVGSGSRWLYNDVVLSRGLRGRRFFVFDGIYSNSLFTEVELSHVGACMTATLSSSHTSSLVLADARIGWPVAPSDFACRDFPPCRRQPAVRFLTL